MFTAFKLLFSKLKTINSDIQHLLQINVKIGNQKFHNSDPIILIIHFLNDYSANVGVFTELCSF